MDYGFCACTFRRPGNERARKANDHAAKESLREPTLMISSGTLCRQVTGNFSIARARRAHETVAFADRNGLAQEESGSGECGIRTSHTTPDCCRRCAVRIGPTWKDRYGTCSVWAHDDTRRAIKNVTAKTPYTDCEEVLLLERCAAGVVLEFPNLPSIEEPARGIWMRACPLGQNLATRTTGRLLEPTICDSHLSD